MVEENKPVEEAPEVKSDSMSNRDALEHALKDVKIESQPQPVAPAEKESQPVKAPVDIDIEPPSAFSAEGKRAWKEKDLAGIQKEYSRLEKSRNAEISRAQHSEREAINKAKTAEQLTESVKTYLTLRGDNAPTDQQLAEAVQLVAELRKNGRAVTQKTLEALFPEGSESANINNAPSAELTTLQQRLEALEANHRQGVLKQTERMFSSVFNHLVSDKNRTGETKYPQLLDTSEEGKEFLRQLGSLTADPRFQAGVQRRFPNADLTTVVREAYKYLGGEVSDDSNVRVSKDNPKQIDRSRRAAASTPGGVVSRNGSDSLIGKLSNRKALEKALERERDREH